MLFILQESVMNGTVTMSTTPIGIEAKSFEKAKEKVLKKAKENKVNLNVVVDDYDCFAYDIEGQEFSVHGAIASQPLKMIKD